MNEQPEINTASNVASGQQQHENCKNTSDVEVYEEDDPFANVEDSERRAFTFSTQLNDEGNTLSETDEVKDSDKKISVQKLPQLTVECKPSNIDEELTPKLTGANLDFCLSPVSLTDMSTPNCLRSSPPLEIEGRKESTQTQGTVDSSMKVHSPYDSGGMEDNYAARNSYELLSLGSRTTMIIHFSPDERSDASSLVDSAEEMRMLEITDTCTSTYFEPELSSVTRNKTRQGASELRKASLLEPLGKEVESEDERITEIFACLRGMLQNNSNPKGLENLTSLEQAFARKGESKQALSNERDDLIAMHLNFVRRVAEEMSNMKMNSRRWVSLS